MKVVFVNNWFDGERRWRKDEREQSVPNELHDRLPKSAKIVDLEDFTAPLPSRVEDEPSLKDFDEDRLAVSKFGDQFNMLSDAAAKMVAAYNLDPEEIMGSGKDGRVTKFDVQDYMRHKDVTRGDVEKENNGSS